MKHLMLTHLLAALGVLTLAVFAATACGDDDEDTGNDGGATTAPAQTIEIMAPFGRATLDTASAYFTVKNNGDTDDALVAASAPVAGMAGLHEVVTQGAETKMQPVDKIDIPAGGQTQLKPGGFHVMLENLTRDLKVGDTYTLTLEFQSGKTMDVEITVESYTSDSGMDSSASPTGGM